MRSITLVTCALAGLLAAPIAISAARADEIRQDHREIRQDERNIQRDQARERQELREGDLRGAAQAQHQEQRDQRELRRDEHELRRDEHREYR